MKHSGENEKAVSPVIAVILMVAITVVLAGLLYIWVNTFSTDSEGEVVYVGFDLDHIYGGWEISIVSVQGQSVSLNTISLSIFNHEKIILYSKALSEANPGPLTIHTSVIYPIPNNSSPVISKQTSNPVEGDDSLTDYVGAIFAYKDANNDDYLSTGDIIRIYDDFDGDGSKDILSNYYFSTKDLSKTHNYISVLL